MKLKPIYQIVALLLALSLLSGFCACQPFSEQTDGTDAATTAPNIDLVIEPTEVKYTEADIAAFSARMTEITARTVYLAEGLRVDEAMRQSIGTRVTEQILPMLERYQVTVTELESLCLAAEEALLAAESSANVLALTASLYRNGLALLGIERTGGIFYESTLLYVDQKIAYLDECYQKYGILGYLEDANLLRAQRTSLTDELGREAYAAATSILFYGLSESSNLYAESERTGTLVEELINDTELLHLLRMQAEQFQQNALTVHQWELTGELLHTFFFRDAGLPGNLQTAEKRMLLLLQESAKHFRAVTATVPTVLSLYQDFANALSPEALAVIRGGDRTAAVGAVCRTLLACEESFVAWATDFEERIQFDSYAERKILINAGILEDYEQFAATMESTNVAALFAAVRTCAETPNGQTADALEQALQAFLHTNAPYLTYLCSKRMYT